MKLERLYQEIIKKGIEADIRDKKSIDKLLKKTKAAYAKCDKKEKEIFDVDSLSNPFADTRLLYGSLGSDIKSVIVGIDVDGSELLVVDRLKDKGIKIDLAVSHHPAGRAFANFYEVMDLQVDMLVKEGISASISENLLLERKNQVSRRLHAANHTRGVDIARLLKVNFLCMHTPCDNLAYQCLRKKLDKEKPAKLDKIMDILYDIVEYKEAAKNNNPPKIVIGNKESRCQHIHLEFTGGTEGSKDIYEQLASKGVDTIVAMHQSEEHFKKCKEANINVIFASHIASDNLGINLMLDYLESKGKFKIYEFSGFKRIPRKK
ncbi:MAG: NGG1p interacting factor NIF3 [Candidatus Omnitrophota bacterium]|nr:MAG: NGG1p interacting factor NIF3 [Candidatus Omnitrophota bacterium]